MNKSIPSITYAQGPWKSKTFVGQRRNARMFAKAVAATDGLYTGVGLRIKQENESKKSMLPPDEIDIFFGVPQPRMLQAWRAMEILTDLTEVRYCDIEGCFHAARREVAPQHVELVEKIERNLPRRREEILGWTPVETHLIEALQRLRKENAPFSITELFEDVSRGLRPLSAELEAWMGQNWRQELRVEKIERNEGRRVEITTALTQLRKAHEMMARPLVDAFEREVTWQAAENLLAFRKEVGEGVQYVLCGRNREDGTILVAINAFIKQTTESETNHLDLHLHQGKEVLDARSFGKMDDVLEWGEHIGGMKPTLIRMKTEETRQPIAEIRVYTGEGEENPVVKQMMDFIATSLNKYQNIDELAQTRQN